MMHIENILQAEAWKILVQPTNSELNISQQPFNFLKNIKNNPFLVKTFCRPNALTYPRKTEKMFQKSLQRVYYLGIQAQLLIQMAFLGLDR
jgi:hypothetical protein